MSQSSYFYSGSILAVAMSLAAGQASAAAAAAPAPAATTVEEVVVTGSFIAGTPKDAALPVDVIRAEDLAKQGSPTVVELIKALPSSSGVYGDANQFGAGRTEGSASVNLRTLGQSRTLVLINGRRMVTSAAGTNPFVDLNTIAPAAIGRLEVLKDGAAATYGSDAIGGVVNFITRKNLNGFEIGGDYSFIDGSDGDYNTRLAYGWQGDKSDILFAAGYSHRSVLPTTARDFVAPKFGDQTSALSAYLYNPQGGWSSAANPGTYLNATNFSSVLDPGCPTLGGQLQISSTRCLFRYVDYDHLVEDTTLWQTYAELNTELSDNMKFHVEALYAQADVKNATQSVTYGPNQYPGVGGASQAPGAVLPYFLIPDANPGLQALKAAFPAFAAAAGNNGLYAHPFFQRPLAVGGNPLFGGQGQGGSRLNDTYRVSADLSGRADVLNGINWDAAATFAQSRADQVTPDFLVDRLELALRGLGSKDGQAACNIATGTAGAGNCYYFNPFSSGVAKNAITGQVNPNYVAGVANDASLISWIYGPEPQHTIQTNRLFVADFVLNGELPFKLGGGNFGWAAGAQYRLNTFDFRANDLTNNGVTPCVDTPINGSTQCAIRNGPYTFYGNYAQANFDSETTAVFAELNAPITDTITANLAIRHEELGGSVGSTTNPKLALRWEAQPWLVFRASAGTTFRAPPANLLLNSAVTGLAFTPQTSSYKPYDTWGNPNLKPEKAKTYSVGAIVQTHGFSATLDWWQFDFDNPLGTESGLNMINALFPIGAPNNCATPGYAALVSRVTFTAAGCGVGNIVRTKTFNINGAAVKTSGVDFSAEYKWPDDLYGGNLKLGLDGAYTIEYKVADQMVEGVKVTPAFDAVGKLNYLLNVSSLPKWKGSAYAEYTNGPHNVRWVVRYIDSMQDQRTSLFNSSQNGQGIVTKGATIDSWITHEIHYRLLLPHDTTFSASIVNVFDEDPPYARLDYSYDPFTANPIGRVIKVGVLKKF
jgi:iron complex outermembrane receptor protein